MKSRQIRTWYKYLYSGDFYRAWSLRLFCELAVRATEKLKKEILLNMTFADFQNGISFRIRLTVKLKTQTDWKNWEWKSYREESKP